MADKLTKEEAISRLNALSVAKKAPLIFWDELLWRFIKSVAAGHYRKDALTDEAVEVANIILESAEIEFKRWYA